jgi:hypothetical protein
MSNVVGVYNSNSVALMVAAIPILDGRADPFVKITKEKAFFKTIQGIDGHVCRCKLNGRLYSVEVNLLGSSRENVLLSALAALDSNTEGGAGIGAFLLKDLQGSSIMAAGTCWLEKPPDYELGETPSESLTWTFAVVSDPMKMIIGGQ